MKLKNQKESYLSPHKKTFMRLPTAISLIVLILTAASYQYLNHRSAPNSSFDEAIHIHLGKQIKTGSGQYNTIALADEYKAKNRKLPSYFWDPLYKHPPLYSILIGLSLKAGLPAITPSILLGSLMILLGFLLCRIFLDEKMSLIGAFFLAIDPIINGCSQKIWLDAPLAFLMTASLLYFIKAINKNNQSCFLWAGLWASLAALTKYPGVLLIVCYFVWAIIYQRPLFKNRYFIFCLLLPIISLTPWFYLYFSVYNQPSQSLAQQHYFSPSRKSFNLTLFGLTAILTAYLTSYWLNTRPRLSSSFSKLLNILKYTLIALTALLLLINLPSILNYWQAPSSSWTTTFFKNFPSYFYLSRLLQYSPILLLGLLALICKKDETPGISILRIYTLIYLGAFIIWGSFQSRYIIPVIPALMTLATIQLSHHIRKPFIKYLIVYLLITSILKTLSNHILLIHPNNFGYF